MTDWLELTTTTRRYGEEKVVKEQFQFVRKPLGNSTRLYLCRFENRFLTENNVGKVFTSPSEHDEVVTYRWDYHTPVSKNLSIDP